MLVFYSILNIILRIADYERYLSYSLKIVKFMKMDSKIFNCGDRCLGLQEFDTHIKIQFKNAKTVKFYYVWLRDHCRCWLCYNTKTYQISSSVLDIPLDIKPSTCEITENFLKILWKDGHNTEFSLQFLECLDFPLHSKKEILLWNKNNVSNLQGMKVPVREFLMDKNGPKRLLNSILKYGFGFVTDIEPTLEATEAIVKHIAPVQKTLFGEMWTVSNNYLHSDTAYTNIALGAHTDNTYFTEPAGLQIFHMLSHEGSGGETLLVDGFNVANNLKNKNLIAFNTLCDYPIQSQYIEKGYHFSTIEPVIKLHPITNELFHIRYNIYDRATLNTISQEKLLQFYAAYQSLGKEICDPENELWIKLSPGSAIFIDNWRVLHGRAAYTGIRDLCGCYVTRAEWLSKAQTLGLDTV